jgi:DNA polymerase-3 subunit alpha
MIPAGDNEELLGKVKDIITKHPGHNPVFIYQGRWQKLGEQYWLDNAPETLALLEEVLGAKGVKKR